LADECQTLVLASHCDMPELDASGVPGTTTAVSAIISRSFAVKRIDANRLFGGFYRVMMAITQATTPR
jgi:hypothetical protein